MTTNDSQTRRDCLRALSTAGAVVGGGIVGVSSVSAENESARQDSTTVDPAQIDLEAVCADTEHGAALFCVENDSDRAAHLEWQTVTGDERIEYLDCQTIRVVGDFAEVMVDATFDTESGIGNVFWEFGPVDGCATFNIAEVADIPENSIIKRTDAFREGTPVVPYGGDISADNPAYDACQEEFFGGIVDAASGSAAGETTASTTSAGETTGTERSATACIGGEDDRNELRVPANGTRCFIAAGGDGTVCVDLFAGDERIAAASSAGAVSCPIPVWWLRRGR
ncbi:hypothetical protein [Natrinema caseinilyticum]|uniref:hypothetical protein n=1 Tax=Natrinema caseinilyticum TaxID=2961570 RepID=UPI0020C2AAB0|nr:hypothetical protein [Natrinema caseinilyticum]